MGKRSVAFLVACWAVGFTREQHLEGSEVGIECGRVLTNQTASRIHDHVTYPDGFPSCTKFLLIFPKSLRSSMCYIQLFFHLIHIHARFLSLISCLIWSFRTCVERTPRAEPVSHPVTVSQTVSLSPWYSHGESAPCLQPLCQSQIHHPHPYWS